VVCPPFLSRPLESSGYADIYLDATHLKGRLGKDQQVCSRALVLAVFLAERFPKEHWRMIWSINLLKRVE